MIHLNHGIFNMIDDLDSPDLKEVTDFVRAGRLLRDPRPSEAGAVMVIHDTEPVLDGRYDVPFDRESDDYYLWCDILSYGHVFERENPDDSIMGRLWLGADELRKVKNLTDPLTLLTNEIAGIIQLQLSDHYHGDFISSVVGNIEWIMFYRSVLGRTVPFIERLFQLYLLGGHPFGWHGNASSGRLVVFFPKST
jgi:hypothetical protein